MNLAGWGRRHLEAGSLAVRRLRAQPVGALLSALIIGIALALPAGGEMLLVNLLRLTQKLSTAPELSLFLDRDASRQASRELADKLRGHRLVKELRFVPREEARERLRQTQELREVIDSLPRNPFPDAFIIIPDSEAPGVLENLKAELQALPEVEHVQLDTVWASRLDALVRLGRDLVAGLGLLLGVALIAIVFNTIRLQIITQREEIELSRLLGASNAFVRRPFLYFGTLQGVFGGVIAWALVSGATSLLGRPVADLAALYGFSFALRPLPMRESLLLVAFAGILGWLGAWLSAARHLRQAESSGSD